MNDYNANEEGHMIKESAYWNRADSFLMEVDPDLEFWNCPEFFTQALKHSRERLMTKFPINVMTNSNVKLKLRCINATYSSDKVNVNMNNSTTVILDWESMTSQVPPRPPPTARYLSWDDQRSIPYYLIIINWGLTYHMPHNPNRIQLNTPETNIIGRMKHLMVRNDTSQTKIKSFLFHAFRNFVSDTKERQLQEILQEDGEFKFTGRNGPPEKRETTNHDEFINPPQQVVPTTKFNLFKEENKKNKQNSNYQQHRRQQSVDLRKTNNSYRDVKKSNNFYNKKDDTKNNFQNKDERRSQRNMSNKPIESGYNPTITGTKVTQEPPTKKTKANDTIKDSKQFVQKVHTPRNDAGQRTPDDDEVEAQLRGLGLTKELGPDGETRWRQPQADPKTPPRNTVKNVKPGDSLVADARPRKDSFTLPSSAHLRSSTPNVRRQRSDSQNSPRRRRRSTSFNRSPKRSTSRYRERMRSRSRSPPTPYARRRNNNNLTYDRRRTTTSSPWLSSNRRLGLGFRPQRNANRSLNSTDDPDSYITDDSQNSNICNY